MSNSCRSTSENTLRKFPLVIATVAKVSRKRGLWLVVRVNDIPAHMDAWAGMDCVNNLISDQPVV